MALVQDIKGKVVLITGAGGGLGSVMVKAFLQEGAKTIIKKPKNVRVQMWPILQATFSTPDIQRRNVKYPRDIAGMLIKLFFNDPQHVAILELDEDAGKKLEQKIKTEFGEDKTKFHKCDVTKDDQLFAAFENTVKEQGSLDVVINNAGILNDREDIYKKAIEINVTAVVTGTLKALKVMGKDNGGEGGTIINISSVAAMFMDPMLPIYHGTKSAVLMFSNCIGMDSIYERTGVRVLTICFGPTDTNLFNEAQKVKGGFDEENSKMLKGKVDEVYLQRPESAVRCVVEAFKSGLSGETWLAVNDKHPNNITDTVKEAYDILSKVADFQ